MGSESATVEPPEEEAPVVVTDRERADDGAEGPDQAVVVTVSLAEFNKLRDEIAGRSTAAWTLLGLNATVTSAAAGFVLAQKADPLLMLLLPLLTPSLGLLFMDHAVNIGNIGTYIDTVLKPLLRGAAREHRLMGYEEWVDRYETHPVQRLLPFGIPLVLLFNATPVASLVYCARFVDTGWAWVIWALGVVVTGVQVGFWVAFLGPPLRRAVQAST